MPVIHALGTCVHVDLGEGIDPDEFTSGWSRCLVADPEIASRVGAFVATEDLPTVTGLGSMTQLTQAITHELIKARRGELLMLHAGAVCHPETGASIAYVAPGGTGKTTLTRLLGAEYGYLTDETVGIEPGSWAIQPYPKPLSTRTAEGGYPKSELGPDGLGLLHHHPTPVLTTLCLLRRTPGLERASVTRLDLFEAITMLVPETSSLPMLDRPLHLLADLYQDLGGIWLVEFGESAQLREWVDDRLGGMIERGKIVDLLVREGESLALTDGHCLRLTEVPTSILEYLAEPRSRAALEAHVAAEFGPPPPGRLDKLLGEMADQGLVKF